MRSPKDRYWRTHRLQKRMFTILAMLIYIAIVVASLALVIKTIGK